MMLAIGWMLAQDVLPQTTDQWGFLALVLTSIGGGVAGVFGWMKSRETKRVDALAESQAKRIEAAELREREAQQRADAREETANRRMDAALQGMAQLTTVTTELTAMMRQMGDGVSASREEVRRLHGSIEALRETLRDARR